MRMRPLRRGEPEHGRNGRVVLGLLLAGTGRAEGFSQFGRGTAAYLGSLAPLLGFLIVLGGAIAWAGRPQAGAEALLSGVCDLLAPAVIAELFCRAWRRQAHWAQYANVLNCAQWLLLAVLILVSPLARLGVSLGLDLPHAVLLPVSVFSGYVLWFHWFVARHVLDLSRGRAIVVMLCVVFGTALLQTPSLLARHAAPG